MNDEPVKWERREGESPRAFDAFRTYRDMLPHERSLDVGAKSYYGEKWTKHKTVQWRRWSMTHGWVARAAAWDAERDRVSREADLAAIAEMRRNHVKESQAIQQVAVEFLKRLQEDLRKDPEKRLAPNHILRMITQGALMERLTRGEPTDITEGMHKVAPMSWDEFLAEQRQARGLPAAKSPFMDDEEGTEGA